MEKNKLYLLCKRVRFYSRHDEDAFFEWLAKIACIEKFEGAGDELYLDLKRKKLSDKDLDEMIGLFYRYKINMKQLAQFLTPQNKEWFYDNKKAFWYRKVFGAKNIIN